MRQGINPLAAQIINSLFGCSLLFFPPFLESTVGAEQCQHCCVCRPSVLAGRPLCASSQPRICCLDTSQLQFGRNTSIVVPELINLGLPIPAQELLWFVWAARGSRAALWLLEAQGSHLASPEPPWTWAWRGSRGVFPWVGFTAHENRTHPVDLQWGGSREGTGQGKGAVCAGKLWVRREGSSKVGCRSCFK